MSNILKLLFIPFSKTSSSCTLAASYCDPCFLTFPFYKTCL